MRRQRRAFSLIELVVATGILALIMGAMASIMVFTSQAMPIKTDKDVRTDADERALREALWMLADAKTFKANASDTVTFITPDIDYDSSDEETLLTFSGTAGDALKFQINGTDQDLIRDVASVTFDVATRTRTRTETSGTYETAEMLLDGWSGPSDATRTCTLTRTLAMRVHPQLPHDATHYRITRARFFVKPVTSKTCLVSMSIADATSGGMPDITKVRTVATTTHTGLASAGAWVSQAFASNTYWYSATERPFLWGGSTNLSAEYELAVDTLAAHAGEFVYQQLGQSAEVATSGAMLYEVYGVVRRPAQVTTTYQAATSLAVHVVRTDGTRITASVALENQPALP